VTLDRMRRKHVVPMKMSSVGLDAALPRSDKSNFLLVVSPARAELDDCDCMCVCSDQPAFIVRVLGIFLHHAAEVE
jgi:hypothetical protein